MRFPEFAEQVKAAPVRMARAVFSGIGQLVLAADRTRADSTSTAGSQQPADAVSPDPQRSRDAARPDHGGAVRLLPASPAGRTAGPMGTATPRTAPATNRPRTGRKSRKAKPPAERRWLSLDATNNVRLLTPEELAATSGPGEPAATSGPGEPASFTAATPPETLPIPDYDYLTLPSLRARLRTLDAEQLRVLLDYEKSTAGRAEVLTMFERRIANLEAGQA